MKIMTEIRIFRIWNPGKLTLEYPRVLDSSSRNFQNFTFSQIKKNPKVSNSPNPLLYKKKNSGFKTSLKTI